MNWLELSDHLARTIREKRKAAGLTQKELATAIGTRQAAIARIESRGNECLPSVLTLKKIADALGADLKIDIQ